MLGDKSRSSTPERGDHPNQPAGHSDSTHQPDLSTFEKRAHHFLPFHGLSSTTDSPNQQAKSSTTDKRAHRDTKEPLSHIELIKSISDNDIGNLEDIMMSRADEQSQNSTISQEFRQRYTEGKAIYESAFQSIRKNLKGKSPDERVKIIQDYLKGNDNNIKKIFQKLLKDKQSEQGIIRQLSKSDWSTGGEGFQEAMRPSSFSQIGYPAEGASTSGKGNSREILQAPETPVAGPSRIQDTGASLPHPSEGEATIETIDDIIRALKLDGLTSAYKATTRSQRQRENIKNLEVINYGDAIHKSLESIITHKKYRHSLPKTPDYNSERSLVLKHFNDIKTVYDNGGKDNKTVKGWYQRAGFDYAQD